MQSQSSHKDQMENVLAFYSFYSTSNIYNIDICSKSYSEITIQLK